MRTMRKKLCLLLAAALCVALMAGCSSNVGEHSSTYIKQMQNVINTAKNSDRLIAEAEAKASEKPAATVAENALAAPANFVVNADGSYSFDAVENAQYYYVYIYADAVTQDASATSEKILDDGSASYTGSVADITTLTYSSWNIRVAAYPDYENSDYIASPEAKCDYLYTGAVDYGTPTFGYMWNVGSGTLTIKVADMEYDRTAYPTDIKLTLTNEADSSDVVVIDVTDIADDSIQASTTDAKADAVYSIQAEFTWDAEYVTNPSFTTDGGEAETSSVENTISGDFYYSSAIYKAFNFPHIQKNFDPEVGGSAGVWYNDGSESSGGFFGFWPGMQQTSAEDEEEEDKSVYFEATPIDAEDGALYSYDIMATSPSGSMSVGTKMAPGNTSADRVFGTLNIYADGTFSMEIEYQYVSTDRVNSAVQYVPGSICYGTYTTNDDGTLNLSYDHENAKETDYEIVTEVTGKAAKYAAEHPEETEEESNAMGGMPGGMPEGGDMPAEEGAPENAEAPAQEDAPEGK